MTTRKQTNRKPKSPTARNRRLTKKRSGALNFETLERRQLLAAITVSNSTDILSPTADTSSIAALVANDGGDGISLREAIEAANNTAGEDAITFDASVFTGGDNSLLRLTQGELVISDSLTIDASSAGGVVITGDADDDDITLADTHITNVPASYSGVFGAPENLLDDNSRVLYFTFASTGDLVLTGLTITGGAPEGIWFRSGGTLTLNQSDVSGNAGRGGIFGLRGNVSLTNSTVSGNSAEYRGGGISAGSGNVSLTNSTVSGNLTATFSASPFLGALGGGISTGSGDITLTNSTVSGNIIGSEVGASGTAYGGGIDTNSGNVSLTNSTVSDNIAGEGGGNGRGGGIYIYNGDLFLINSIVAGNTAASRGPDIVFSGGGSQVIQNSLIGDTTESGLTATTGNGNILNQPALLGPLALNGGPTQTHALLPDSPAINTGSNALAVDANGSPLTTDQRGEDRVQVGTVDIGAFESNLSIARSLVVTTTQDVEDPNDGITSLREAIAFANDPTAGPNSDGDADGDGLVTDTVTFSPSVFTGGDNSLIRLTQGELEINDSLTIDASSVGGVVITGDANDDDITVAGTHVTNVPASYSGFYGAPEDLLDDNSRVLIFPAPTGDLTLTGLTISGGVPGGIRFLSDGTLTLSQSSISGNEGRGGISSPIGNVSLINSTVSGNSSSVSGGGISTGSGDVSLTNSTVSGNFVSTFIYQFFGGDGGGISTGNGDVFLTNSTVSGNFVGNGVGGTAYGGGISTFYGDISLTNSTVTGNDSGGDGGGHGIGGGLFTFGGSLFLSNSIVAGNTAVGSSSDIRDGGQRVVENSLIGDTTGSGIDAATGSGNILNQPALLGPLTLNGGPTQTHALLPGSPAIDAGSNALALDENGNPLTTDQRGRVRNRFGTVDIGAFEFEGTTLLGDANLDGNVNLLDISPFISLVSGGGFLDEADIDRNGVVNFLDISPFIAELNFHGSFQSSSVIGSLVVSAISGGLVETSQAIVAEPPVDSAVSLVSVTSTPEVPITTTAPLPQYSDAKPLPSTDSQNPKATASLPPTSFIPASDLISSPVSRTFKPLAVDTSAAEAVPIDNVIGAIVVAPVDSGSLTGRNSNSRGSERSEPLVTRRSLGWSTESLDLPRQSRDKNPTANVPSKESFSTAAELFDAHPESLDEIFELQFGETLPSSLE